MYLSPDQLVALVHGKFQQAHDQRSLLAAIDAARSALLDLPPTHRAPVQHDLCGALTTAAGGGETDLLTEAVQAAERRWLSRITSSKKAEAPPSVVP